MMPGEKLGYYEIIARIGAGGMGEVYRALDPRLKREVAIKLLPPSGDKARFRTEARALAALNHPNIVAIFDVGENYIVTELIDGVPLKATGLRQAIDLVAQAADGLSAAHSIGIFHRDIKPQNLLVTHEGRVKLIDFGLAKDTAHGSDAETVTADGTVMGTAPYMSPEQVRGEKLDARSDLFSLGIVLYEQVVGKRPFQGETVAQTMSAVLEKEPPDPPECVPGGLKQILYRCLAKEKAARFQNAADLAFALRALGTSSPSGPVQTQIIAAPARRTSLRIWQAVAAAFAVSLGVAIWAPWRTPHPPAPPFRLVVQSPVNLGVSNDSGSAISPDGRTLAFIGDVKGRAALHVRPLDVLEARALPGTDGAGRPFWSPDSKSIAFFAGEKLMRADLAGGAPQTICEISSAGRGGSWNRNGAIVFSTSLRSLALVSASGGEPQAITELDAKNGEDAHYYPQFLPDGRSFVYFRRRADRSRSGVYIGRIGDPDRGRNDKLLLTTQHRAVYAPTPGGRSGHLLFVRGSSLFSQPFDPARQELGGQPALLAENVSLISANAYSDVSSSDTGIVAYALGGGGRRVLTKRDRTGKPLGEPIEFSEVVNASLSHDGRKMVWSRADDSLWFTDLTRNTTSRFVYDGPVTGAVWSPNDQRIAFEAEGIYAAPADGSGKSEKLFQSSSLSSISDWSRDGRFLLFSERLKDTQYDLFALPMTAPHKPFPVAQGRSNEMYGAFSPDGRWIAFYSDETGRMELYVQGFPSLAASGWFQPKELLK